MLQPIAIVATNVVVLVILERSIGVESAEACSVSSLANMADAIRPCQTQVLSTLLQEEGEVYYWG